MERPAGVPVDFAEHARLMFDLMVAAFQTDHDAHRDVHDRDAKAAAAPIARSASPTRTIR